MQFPGSNACSCQPKKVRTVMPQIQKTWDSDQLKQMNEEAFLVDLLDMIKISPVIDDNDSAINKMKARLDSVEAMIRDRLES